MANTHHHQLPYFHLTSISTHDLRLRRPLAAGDAIAFRLCMGCHTIDVDAEDMDSTSSPRKALVNQPLHGHPLPPAFTIQVLHRSALAGARPVAAANIPTSDVAVDGGDFHRLLKYKLRGRHGEENGVVNLTAKLVRAAVGDPVPLSPPSMMMVIVPRFINGPYLEVSQISVEDLMVSADEAYAVVRTGPASASTAATGIVRNGGSSPWWEELLRLPVPATTPGSITVEVWRKRRRKWLAGDLLAGAAEVPMSDIVDDYVPAEEVHFLSYRLLDKKGERVGIVNFAVKLAVAGAGEEKTAPAAAPVREDKQIAD